MKLKRVFGIICILAFFQISIGQTIIDPCFTSPSSGTTFAGTANLSNNNSDLLNWTGASWTGAWGGAGISLAPPGSVPGTRAIWCGDGTVWTTGGEGFGLRLSAGLTTGVTYTFTYSRVSHGTGSAGSFAPRLYTNSTGTFGFLVGNIPTAGSSWFTGPITFTAVAGQSGHTWIYFHSNTPNGSGMFLACESAVLPMQLWNLRGWKSNNGNMVEWNAKDEFGFSKHILERSNDGENFSPVNEVAVNAAFGEHHYALVDRNPVTSKSNFYRVVTLNEDGGQAESPVIEIQASETAVSEISVGPNPARGGESISLQIFSPEAEKVQVVIRDLNGRQLQSKSILVESGFSEAKFPLPNNLSSGLIWLSISGKHFNETKVISIQD